MELAYDAAHPEPMRRYGCAITPCISSLVDDLDELSRCEKCDRRICSDHAASRLTYVVCPDCDRAEKLRLEVLLPHLHALIDGARDQKIPPKKNEGSAVPV